MAVRITAMLGVVVLLIGAFPATAEAAIPADFACRSGQVHLTFDDGPHKTFTPRLLKTLRTKRVRATFFVTGKNTQRHKKIVKTMVRDGHAVGNHTWNHDRLTAMSSKAVRANLKRSSRAIKAATGRKVTYWRPPYGATNGRVKKVAKKLALTQELWTVDTRDWDGRSAKTITKAAVNGVKKHRKNVILLHDAVGNSPATLSAVPHIIKKLRGKGYCFTPLEWVTAWPTLGAQSIVVAEPASGQRDVKLPLRLSERAPERGAVRVSAVNGSATRGKDFTLDPQRIVFARGQQVAYVKAKIPANLVVTGPRYFYLVAAKPKNLRVRESRIAVTIADAPGGIATAPASWMPILTR